MSLALPSRALLPSRLLPPGSCLRPIDPTAVALQLVCGLLVAGDVHQLQVLGSEEQAVEVLPVHLPPILDGFSQRGYHGALLLYYMIQVPGTEEDPALSVAIGVDGVLGKTALQVKGALAGEPSFWSTEAAAGLCTSVEIAAIVLHRFELLAHGAKDSQVLFLSCFIHHRGVSAHLS